MSLRVLGIETSCDETAAAVVSTEGEVVSDVVHSQIELHRPHGGVVPELAARDHLQRVLPVVEQALADAQLGFGDVDGVAVTVRPGLAGALLVGSQVAKTIAAFHNLPLVGVDHLVGHLGAVFLKRAGKPPLPLPEYPFVGLLASGGHTGIYRVDHLLEGGVTELGGTRDDAAGEAFDKVAKLLGLGYPGGPIIDKLAKEGDDRAFSLPLPMLKGQSLEFSFSGMKTSVANLVRQRQEPFTEQEIKDLCASFQRAMVEVLVRKLGRAAKSQGIERLVLCGGVAANRGLRARAQVLCDKRAWQLYVPPVRSCTDNGAMIAYAGALQLQAGKRDDWRSLDIQTRTGLPRVTRKGRGPRGRKNEA